jgi:hypothetical protein
MALSPPSRPLDIVTGEQDQSPQRRVTVFYNDGFGNFTLHPHPLQLYRNGRF